MRTGRSRVVEHLRGALCVCASLCIGGPAFAQAPKKSTTVRHVEISGDLNSMRLVARLDDEIAASAKAGAGLLLLEMDGDKWRSDVVWAAGQKIKASPVPVAVYLSDAAGRSVGVGPLILGLLATDCFVEPGTTVRGAPGDDLRDLAPDQTDFEQVIRELSGAIYARLSDLGGAADLADVLVGLEAGKPQPPMWALYESGSTAPARLVREEPADAAPGARKVPIVTRAFDGSARLAIPAEAGTRLRIFRGAHASPGAVANALGYRAGIKSHVRLESGLDEARRQAAADFDALDGIAERVKATLDLPDPPDAATSPDRYRRAGRAGLDEIDAGKALLRRSEQALEDYPELLRAPAPGQTSVGGKPSVYASRWRSVIQSRRDKLDKLEAKARLFAGR